MTRRSSPPPLRPWVAHQCIDGSSKVLAVSRQELWILSNDILLSNIRHLKLNQWILWTTPTETKLTACVRWLSLLLLSTILTQRYCHQVILVWIYSLLFLGMSLPDHWSRDPMVVFGNLFRRSMHDVLSAYCLPWLFVYCFLAWSCLFLIQALGSR